MRDERYVLLRPKYVPKIDIPANWITTRESDVWSYIRGVKPVDADDGIAFDTETNSLNVFGNPDFKMVGFSLSHGNTGIYLDLNNFSQRAIVYTLKKLREILVFGEKSLICHNLFYDMSVTRFYLGRDNDLPFIADTYGLSRYLATESFFGQKHGLKDLMSTMLLWADTNETERDNYLIEHGFVNGSGKPAKGEMYRCPAAILGPYCILDSYGTYQLYREIMLPAIRKYTTGLFTWFHREVFMCLVRECVSNYEAGIFIDRERLLSYDVTLISDILRTKQRIYRESREAINNINAELVKKHAATRPEVRYRGIKPVADCPSVEYTKSGKVSKSWISKALRHRRFIRQTAVGGELSKSYGAYMEFHRELKRWQHLTPIFDEGRTPERFRKWICNLNSGEHKRGILYHNLQVSIKKSERRGKPDTVVLPNGMELDMTDSGMLPTGKSAITAIMGMEAALSVFNGELKKQQFTRSVLEKLTPGNRLHLRYKVPGTQTGRISGDGGLNLTNIVKDPMFLSAWRIEHPTDTVIFSADFAALEPHVLAELSRDRSSLSLYGPDAKPNDIYIYTAASMGGELGQPFLDLGYDPSNPTKDAIELCKKKYKKLRNVAKLLVLSDSYGSGALKKYRTLRVLGYEFTFDQVKEMQDRLAEVYRGQKTFGKKLTDEWEANGGYVLGGLGFPVCACEEKKRDLTSSVVQSTGHHILMLALWKFTGLLSEHGIWHRPIIADYHDEFDYEIRVGDVEIAKRLLAETVRWINDDFLKAQVRLKMDPQIATNLAEVKCEGYKLDAGEIADLIEELNEAT